MAPRISTPTRALARCLPHSASRSSRIWLSGRILFNSVHTASTATIQGSQLPIQPASPPSKPASARPITTRKSQLIRSYTALLRSSPLLLFFQHSNLTAVEWAAVRRELKKALASVPRSITEENSQESDITENIRIEVLTTNMFNVALKIVEFHDPEAAASRSSTTHSSTGPLVHDLSEAAYESIKSANIQPSSNYAQIEPLMVGPLAALVLPAVSPAHLAAALSVLAPVPGRFPAPTRKKSPGYHDVTCQNGLAKLLLVGGRVERKIFDQAGISWVGGIEGGLDGLRAQLVHLLQSPSIGLTRTLESCSNSIWFALEGRREQLDATVE